MCQQLMATWCAFFSCWGIVAARLNVNANRSVGCALSAAKTFLRCSSVVLLWKL